MFVIVEIDIYNSDNVGNGAPTGAYGPFNTREEAYRARSELEIDHQDDPVEFAILSVVKYN